MPRRKCKCQVCGTWGYTDEFYRVRGNNRNLYYCNENEYLNMLDEQIARVELLRYISSNIWYHSNWKMLPPILQKELKELAEIYNYEVVLETVKKKEDDLKYWMGLEDKFNTEYAQSRYLATIIKNEINPVWKDWQERQRVTRKAEQTAKELDVDVLNDLQNRPIKKKRNKGISDFLREGDL